MDIDLMKYPKMFLIKFQPLDQTCDNYGEQLHKCIFLNNNIIETSNTLFQKNCFIEFTNYAKNCLK